jgi:hypothetical protein
MHYINSAVPLFQVSRKGKIWEIAPTRGFQWDWFRYGVESAKIKPL